MGCLGHGRSRARAPAHARVDPCPYPPNFDHPRLVRILSAPAPPHARHPRLSRRAPNLSQPATRSAHRRAAYICPLTLGRGRTLAATRGRHGRPWVTPQLASGPKRAKGPRLRGFRRASLVRPPATRSNHLSVPVGRGAGGGNNEWREDDRIDPALPHGSLANVRWP